MAVQTTIAVYPLDGTNRKFVVPYEYLTRRFVTVTLLGTNRKPLVLGTDFRFITANQIETTQAWGVAQGYDNIEVRRETSATQRLVDFYDGSVLRSRDLNVSAIQSIHIAEEARNLAADTLASDDDGNLDARGRRLVNLGNAVNPQDAMPLGQFVERVTEWSQSAFNQANRSQTEANRSQTAADDSALSRAAALGLRNAAKTSETNAKASEVAAKASEVAAKTSETTSTSNAQSALASKNAAAISKTNAKDSEIAALQYRNEASEFTPANHLLKASNLSDVEDKVASRTNLGLNLTDAEIVKLKALLAAVGVSGVNITCGGTVNATDVYIRGE